MKQLRNRLTYANVMSSLAVFLVLGGATAFAATKIGANQLKANSVKTGKIVKEAVTTSKIKNNAVNTAKIANDAVTGQKVLESSLGQVPSAASAADAAKLGGQDPGAYQSRVRWALVNSTANGNVGQILAQSGGVSIAAGASGFSYLNWGENIGNRALQVSIAQTGEGFITVTPCGNGEVPADTVCAPAGTNNPNHTIVRMDDPAGASDNQTYFITVTK
ncbi:MAG TPA: hypothetical protein VFZ19_09390 [Solirubrobacterales bacterium]